MKNQVLLVDDDATLLRALMRMLNEDFDVVSATSGREALEMFEESGPYAVLVSDMKMPRMDGMELVLQTKERWPETICMILTGNQDETTIARVEDSAKVHKLLNKPSPRRELVDAIEQALQIYDSNAALA